jgi:hypothetical protein
LPTPARRGGREDAANAESAVIIRRITTMTTAGRMSGSVMCMKRCQALARSSRAASNTSGGSVASDAAPEREGCHCHV